MAVAALTVLLQVGVLSAAAPPLTFVEVIKDGDGTVDGLNDARKLTVSPDGKHVYVAASIDDAVGVFSRSSNGSLTFVEVQKDGVGGVDGLDGALWVRVSPDGKHVYAAGAIDDKVAVFSRNVTTGALTFVEVQEQGVGGVDGIDGIGWVSFSSDGKHLYTAAPLTNAVAVFSRNATTGALTFVEVLKDGVGGVDGLDGANTLTVSPDGKHLYATAQNDNAVAVFSRNATTGALTFVEILKDGIGGVDGLAFAHSVTVSPDGSHVYAGGASDDAVAVFSRNATTGALTFLEIQKDGVGGVDGLDFANSVSMSPDGKHLYAGGSIDDAVAVFSTAGTVVGTLASTSVIPNSLVAGTTFTVVVTFTTVGAVSAGKVQVTFPTGFGVSSAGVNASGTNITGSLAIDSVVGQVVTIKNATISAGQAGAAFTLTLINNPHVTGGTGVFGIETQSVGGFLIDQDTSVAQVTITAGALDTTSVVPASLVSEATGNVVVTFTTRNEVTAGKVQVTFPSGFDVSGAGVNASGTNITGSLALDSVAGQIVTINSATIAASQSGAAFTLTGIKNPTATGGTGVFGIETQTGGDVKIDEDTSVAQVTITAAVVAVPGVSTWGLIVLAVLMAGAALVILRRKKMQQV